MKYNASTLAGLITGPANAPVLVQSIRYARWSKVPTAGPDWFPLQDDIYPGMNTYMLGERNAKKAGWTFTSSKGSFFLPTDGVTTEKAMSTLIEKLGGESGGYIGAQELNTGKWRAFPQKSIRTISDGTWTNAQGQESNAIIVSRVDGSILYINPESELFPTPSANSLG